MKRDLRKKEDRRDENMSYQRIEDDVECAHNLDSLQVQEVDVPLQSFSVPEKEAYHPSSARNKPTHFISPFLTISLVSVFAFIPVLYAYGMNTRTTRRLEKSEFYQTSMLTNDRLTKLSTTDLKERGFTRANIDAYETFSQGKSGEKKVRGATGLITVDPSRKYQR